MTLSRRQRLLFCLFAGVPSLAVLERLLTVVGPKLSLPDTPVVFLAAGMVAVWALYLLLPHFFKLADKWQRLPTWLALGYAALLAMFFVVYPMADSGQLGFNSDRDEAIDVAVGHLLAGHNPYECRAVSGVHEGCPEAGNPISPLPGAFILALPFVLLFGGSAIQNFFWLGVFYLAARRWFDSSKQAAVTMLALTVLVPTVLAEVFTGGDLLANTLAVSAALLLCLRARTTPQLIAFGTLLGLALAWRVNFVLLAAPLLVFHLKHGHWRQLGVFGTASAITFVAVALPLWWLDPAAFTPLHADGKLGQFDQLLPMPNVWAVALATSVSGFVAWYAKSDHGLLLAVAIALLLPPLMGIVLKSIVVVSPSVAVFGWYALSATVLGLFSIQFQEDNKP